MKFKVPKINKEAFKLDKKKKALLAAIIGTTALITLIRTSDTWMPKAISTYDNIYLTSTASFRAFERARLAEKRIQNLKNVDDLVKFMNALTSEYEYTLVNKEIIDSGTAIYKYKDDHNHVIEIHETNQSYTVIAYDYSPSTRKKYLKETISITK
ncbi:MAG: hypothetical protein QXF76_01380 [Candidatus Anstonellales archaeon]